MFRYLVKVWFRWDTLCGQADVQKKYRFLDKEQAENFTIDCMNDCNVSKVTYIEIDMDKEKARRRK